MRAGARQNIRVEELIPGLTALLLVGVASSVPWALGRICGDRWRCPLDFGVMLWDGERLFGDHKTWRGLVAGIAACSVVGLLIGVGYRLGATVGFLALAGDALSSAIKRRLRRPPGTEVAGLDQGPEAFLPLLVLRQPLGLSFASIIIVTLVFAVLDIALAPLRHSHRSRYVNEQER